jgi:hypothetical protein
MGHPSRGTEKDRLLGFNLERGRIGFMESINAEKGRRLRAIFDQIAWE